MAGVNDGGPAFPEKRASKYMASGPNGLPHPIFETVGGMSLRDWFAGQALSGLMVMVAEQQHDLPAPGGAVGMAAEAYRLADAMLSARSKSGGE
jgi:hypothetical protein